MMRDFTIESIIKEVFGNNAKLVSGNELTEASETYGGLLRGMVFLPTGDGYIMLDEENTQDERGNIK